MNLWDRIRPLYCKLTPSVSWHDLILRYFKYYFPCMLSAAVHLRHPLNLPPADVKSLYELEKRLVVLECWLAGLILATAIVIRIAWLAQAPADLESNAWLVRDLRLALFIVILVIYQRLLWWLARPFAESIVVGALVYSLKALDEDDALNTRRSKERIQRYMLIAAAQTLQLARLLAATTPARKAVAHELRSVAAYFRRQEVEIALLGTHEAQPLRDMLARMLPLYLAGHYRQLTDIVPEVPNAPLPQWKKQLPRLLGYIGISMVIWWVADLSKRPVINLLIIFIATRALDDLAETGLTKTLFDFLAALKVRLYPKEPPTSRADEPVIKVLFLASNPINTISLRLDEEIRAIDQALRQSEFRDRFDLRQHWAVRVADLQGLLLRHRPEIVHFSGHGSQASEISLEDDLGKSHPVSVRALSELFSLLKDNIRCVILNACYSEEQARAIAQHIDCVIGMSTAITDESSIRFAAAFYQALGFGRDVKTAFDLGCSQIDLESLAEQDTPKLLAVKGDPRQMIFVRED
jgi:hypothetical protein